MQYCCHNKNIDHSRYSTCKCYRREPKDMVTVQEISRQLFFARSCPDFARRSSGFWLFRFVAISCSIQEITPKELNASVQNLTTCTLKKKAVLGKQIIRKTPFE